MKIKNKINKYVIMGGVAFFVIGLVAILGFNCNTGSLIPAEAEAATLAPKACGSSATNPCILDTLTPAIVLVPKSGIAIQYKLTPVGSTTAKTYTSPIYSVKVTVPNSTFTTPAVPTIAGLQKEVVYEVRAQSCSSTKTCNYIANNKTSTGSGFSAPLNYFKIQEQLRQPHIFCCLFGDCTRCGGWLWWNWG